jgi:hypothetical protein
MLKRQRHNISRQRPNRGSIHSLITGQRRTGHHRLAERKFGGRVGLDGLDWRYGHRAHQRRPSSTVAARRQLSTGWAAAQGHGRRCGHWHIALCHASVTLRHASVTSRSSPRMPRLPLPLPPLVHAVPQPVLLTAQRAVDRDVDAHATTLPSRAQASNRGESANFVAFADTLAVELMILVSAG